MTDPTATEQRPADAERAGGASDSEQSGKKRRRRRRRKRGGDGESSGSEDVSQRGDRRRSEDVEPETPQRKANKSTQSKDVFADLGFADLGLRNSVLKGIDALGFEKATKIQADLIPLILEGRDVLGQAKTGSGKTAAFGLPLFHMQQRGVEFQSIILCPTRELAIQIAADLEAFGRYTPIRVAAVYGGQAVATQAKRLEEGPEIIVATPGRLMDFYERKNIHFNNVRFAILDEVDRMLDIGFRDDIKRILKSIKGDHQTIFVSATISEEIEKLGRTFMKDDAEKMVATAGSLTVEMVQQHHLTVNPWDKKRLLVHLLTHEEPALTVVFCRTKRMVDDLTEHLTRHNIDAHAIHGDMHQGKRNRVMNKLRQGQLGVLVASDLAARGLDVDDISHVVNYDLPEDSEIYIHRIGRTARAGREGVAWSFVTPIDGPLLTNIEKLANVEIPKLQYDDFEPSPEPAGRRRDREAKEREKEVAAAARAAGSRFAPPPVPAVEVSTRDAHRFPDGLAPTQLPPRLIGGRARTDRGIRQAMASAPAPKPEED